MDPPSLPPSPLFNWMQKNKSSKRYQNSEEYHRSSELRCWKRSMYNIPDSFLRHPGWFSISRDPHPLPSIAISFQLAANIGVDPRREICVCVVRRGQETRMHLLEPMNYGHCWCIVCSFKCSQRDERRSSKQVLSLSCPYSINQDIVQVQSDNFLLL